MTHDSRLYTFCKKKNDHQTIKYLHFFIFHIEFTYFPSLFLLLFRTILIFFRFYLLQLVILKEKHQNKRHFSLPLFLQFNYFIVFHFYCATQTDGEWKTHQLLINMNFVFLFEMFTTIFVFSNLIEFYVNCVSGCSTFIMLFLRLFFLLFWMFNNCLHLSYHTC